MSPTRSLRDRLVVGALVSTSAVLAVGGVAVYASVRHRLERELDRSLETLARSASAVLVADHVRLLRVDGPRPNGPRSPLQALVERNDVWVQGWAEDGLELARSEHLVDDELPRAAAPLDVVAPGTTTLADGTTLRTATLSHRPPTRRPRRPRPGAPAFLPPDPPVLTVTVARGDAELRAALAHLRRILLLTGAGAVLAGAALLTLVVRRSLRPLDALGDEIARLDDSRLDRRIVVEDAPAELAPVIDRLNESVARIGRAFERERSFAGAAAHELRTPLAGLRATLEVSASRERPPAEHLEAERTCLAIVERMEALVLGLLELARSDAPAAADAVPCSLADGVSDALRTLGPLLDARRLTVRSSGADEAVRADERLLRRLVSNLLENAATYADEGSAIEVAAERDGGDVVWTVGNDAAGLPADAGARAFETFWRADAAREAGAHVGLGLPLCRRIAERLGGAIDATSADGRFVVTLRLPAA